MMKIKKIRTARHFDRYTIMYFMMVLFVCFLLVKPNTTFAAKLFFSISPNASTTDKSVLVNVAVDPQSKVLNVLDGTIGLVGSATNDMAVEVNTFDSVLKLWPVIPTYNTSEKVIRFTGGVPDGFSGGGSLFIIKLIPPLNGELQISWNSIDAYLNDGKGTRDDVHAIPIKISFDNGKPVVTEVLSGFSETEDAIIVIVVIFVLCVAFVYAQKKIFKK